ncbi:hypothetical protein L3Q82_004133 [Scortum barcoo]|uniref:Uncharacterized protein n=1 Tax=Scortum barcoo TaxID=214431 RepID=A0ACB8X7A2_9TELE|nr:hypothetical protein L3Q82_004133 [Scortum barcoo]
MPEAHQSTKRESDLGSIHSWYYEAVSCPGVHLSAKDDVYLSMCFMGQYRQSECLPAVFPLLFHEKMTFEKAGLYM